LQKHTTKNIKVLAIVGPTGSGKSEAAVNVGLALKQAEIVSADSMLVYKGMDIGTAKPAKTLRSKLPHHLIDLIDPSENFSVALYQQTARQVIKEIWERKNLPILVGGTGLYVRAVLDGLNFPQGDLSSAVRANYAKLAAKEPLQLWQLLAAKDPIAAAKIEPANSRRVIRALEVIELTGRPFSYWQQNWHRREAIYQCLIVGLTMTRQNLYQKLEARVEKMLKDGLVEEVKKLKNQTLSTTARQALGYKEILAYLDGQISLKVAVELIKLRTRRYAKRQFTWFKADPRIHWLNVDNLSSSQIKEEILKLVKAKEFIVI
jgi:tRNA dimethylallyltransferase